MSEVERIVREAADRSDAPERTLLADEIRAFGERLDWGPPATLKRERAEVEAIAKKVAALEQELERRREPSERSEYCVKHGRVPHDESFCVYCEAEHLRAAIREVADRVESRPMGFERREVLGPVEGVYRFWHADLNALRALTKPEGEHDD